MDLLWYKMGDDGDKDLQCSLDRPYTLTEALIVLFAYTDVDLSSKVPKQMY